MILKKYATGLHFTMNVLMVQVIPLGKKSSELNTQERIMACVDIYQALTESRPYKQGMPHEKAYGILKDMAEKGWLDADIVAMVDECFDKQNKIK